MTVRFTLRFIDEAALKEYRKLDGSKKKLVDSGLSRLRQRADAIGKPLSGRLSGCKELKFRANGFRIIYRIVGDAVEIVEIIAIGARENNKVFKRAEKRIE